MDVVRALIPPEDFDRFYDEARRRHTMMRWEFDGQVFDLTLHTVALYARWRGVSLAGCPRRARVSPSYSRKLLLRWAQRKGLYPWRRN